MPTLTVTAKGQITLKQELLRHLNVTPGQKVEVDKLPDGRLRGRGRIRQRDSIAEFSGSAGEGRHAKAHHRTDQEDYRRRMGGETLKIVADTNVLLRDALRDDPLQTRYCLEELLQSAELVAIPIAALCEFVWVMRQGL
jgi:antitoxin PrlF